MTHKDKLKRLVTKLVRKEVARRLWLQMQERENEVLKEELLKARQKYKEFVDSIADIYTVDEVSAGDEDEEGLDEYSITGAGDQL